MMTNMSKYIDCPLMYGLMQMQIKKSFLSMLCVLFFFFFYSDQEPPYSMITLHEMAETGKEKTACCSWTLKHHSSVLLHSLPVSSF